LLPESRADDEYFEPLKQHFNDAEIAKLTIAIGNINIWNRIAVGSRMQHPVDHAAKAA
jgi:alkylhydroperoxidase family enzyme